MLVRRWTMVGADVIHSRETTGADRIGTHPLVLLHGVGATTRYFRPLLHALQGRAPAVAMDLPGIGPSSSHHPPSDIPAQADVVAEWLRTRWHHPATLVGNSMGAQTAVEVALRHPRLAERLVLIGPTMDAAARGPLRQVVRLLLDAPVERPGLIWLTVSDSFLTRRRDVVRYFAASLDHHIEDRVPRVVVPVLVVRGERDPVVPRRWARELAGLAPRGSFAEVRGAAHACHHGRPRAVADLLLQAVASPATESAHVLGDPIVRW